MKDKNNKTICNLDMVYYYPSYEESKGGQIGPQVSYITKKDSVYYIDDEILTIEIAKQCIVAGSAG